MFLKIGFYRKLSITQRKQGNTSAQILLYHIFNNHSIVYTRQPSQLELIESLSEYPTR